MRFPTRLVRGSLVRRYKRFLADVRLDSGEVVTVHCANPGSMLGLIEPGTTVWLTRSEAPARKLAWSWQLLDLRLHGRRARVGIHTGNPNRIVAEAIAAGLVPELAGYGRLRNEVRYGRNSRIDFLLEDDAKPPCYVEVKNVHLLRRPGLAEFPDSVTARGVKHLAELSAMARAGARAVMFFLVQRNDAERLGLARDLDPGYASAFAAARAAGVEAVVYSCKLSRREIRLDRAIPMTEECGALALPAGNGSE